MQPIFKTLSPKKLIGIKAEMSLMENQTAQLWQQFMPKRKEIKNPVTTALYSLQVYPPGYFEQFNPARVFEKWALAEVTSYEVVPGGMDTFELPGGLYAVFVHRGSSLDNSTFEYIFSTWLAGAAYELDQRPHFELLGEKYRNNDPSSEEEIWIPVKPK